MNGKNVLITGAARGIGAETARRLSARGARVALLGLEPEELERVASQCGPDAIWIEVDVTDREALTAAVDDAAERLGGLDVAIANAGIATYGMLDTTDPDAWERTINVNVIGVYRTLHAAIPHVVERGGYLLAIASLAAVVHGPLMSAYAGSKAAVEAIGDSLRLELRHKGVDVGVGYFSWIDTDMVQGAYAVPAYEALRGSLRGPFKKTHPLSKAADAVVRGVEKRSRWVTAPNWIRAMIPLRGLMQLVAERDAAEAVPEAARLWEREVADKGAEAASGAIGRGGAADDAQRGALH